LVQRAARGGDLAVPPPRVHLPADAPEPSADPAAQPPKPVPRTRNRHPRPSWRDVWLGGVADPLDPHLLPSFRDLVAQARRRPIGRSLGDICADLGVAPRSASPRS